MDIIKTFDKGLKLLVSVVEETTQRISDNNKAIENLNATNENLEYYKNKAQKILDI